MIHSVLLSSALLLPLEKGLSSHTKGHSRWEIMPLRKVTGDCKFKFCDDLLQSTVLLKKMSAIILEVDIVRKPIWSQKRGE